MLQKEPIQLKANRVSTVPQAGVSILPPAVTAQKLDMLARHLPSQQPTARVVYTSDTVDIGLTARQAKVVMEVILTNTMEGL